MPHRYSLVFSKVTAWARAVLQKRTQANLTQIYLHHSLTVLSPFFYCNLRPALNPQKCKARSVQGLCQKERGSAGIPASVRQPPSVPHLQAPLTVVLLLYPGPSRPPCIQGNCRDIAEWRLAGGTHLQSADHSSNSTLNSTLLLNM